MSKMLLSIKPEYVDRILAGKKKYEFRKFRCRQDIDTIVIYATAPVKKIVAEAKIDDVLEGDIEEIWQRTKPDRGITKKAYAAYYRGREIAIAYKLGKIVTYQTPKTLDEIGLNYTPQSFAYLE